MALVELNLEEEIDELLSDLDRSRKRVIKAMRRTDRKMFAWLNREVKKITSKTLGLPAKRITENKRIASKKRRQGGGGVWIGLNPLKAHWIGGRQLKKGAKVGKEVFPNAWWNEKHSVFFRRDSRGKLDVLKIDVADKVEPRLKRIVPAARKRFKEIFKQELHYALNVENR